MKLPSLSYLYTNAKYSLKRFPLTIISSIIAVAIGIYLVEIEPGATAIFPFIHALLAFALGIPVFFILGVLSENDKHPSISKRWILNGLGAAFLLLIYFGFPGNEITNNTYVPYIRYAIFNLIAHLVVSYIPYLKSRKLNGFWNYNKILFLRFLEAILYSTFLYLGLILALTSLDLLFNIDLHNELYFELFILIFGVFNTWFFVAGIPENLYNLEGITTYPKGLKIFTQYVLLPLLVLYLIILYVYGAKILIEQNCPKGIVSYLISGVATLGIFTLLLIYPYGKSKENVWIQKFTLIYYFLLIPLIVLLFYAIFIRLADYGITINRYIIVLLGIWLSIVSIYFILRKENIKFIPISLAIILALMSFGPWGMFSISEKSQVKRLEKILTQAQLLKNSKIESEVEWSLDSNLLFKSEDKNRSNTVLNDSLNNEVYSILNYLEHNHGMKAIQPWFNQNLDSLYKVSIDSNRYLSEAKIYMATIGLEYRYIYSSTYNRYN